MANEHTEIEKQNDLSNSSGEISSERKISLRHIILKHNKEQEYARL